MFENINELESVSVAVKYSDLPQYNWYTYKGLRTKKMESGNFDISIPPKAVFGIKPIRGNRAYLIFPDKYYVAYPIAENDLVNLVKRSHKRKAPRIEDVRAGRGNKNSSPRAPRRPIENPNTRVYDPAADRYYPTRNASRPVPESKHGVFFQNYQWRKLNVPKFKYSKTLDKFFEMEKGQVFGLRFLKESRGGVIAFPDGTSWAIPTDKYDYLVENSPLLPLNKWLKGKVTLDEIKRLKKDKEISKALQEKEAREKIREAKREAKRKRLEEIQRKKLEKQEKARKEALRLAGMKDSAPAIYAPVKDMDDIVIEESSKRMQDKEKVVSDLDDMAADDDGDFDFDDLDDFDNVDLEDDDIIDEDEIVSVDADSDAIGQSLDTEIDGMREELSQSMEEDEDEEDEADFEDEDEELPDDEEDPDIEEESELEEPEEETEIEDDPDDEVQEDTEEVEEIEEDESEEPVDLDDIEQESYEEDEDAELAEEEDDSEPVEDVEETKAYEEGDVIQFKDDTTEQREYLILDIYPLKKNDAITVYKVYDITNDPMEYQTVRISSKTNQSIEKEADFVRKLNPKEFTKYFNNMENYDKSNEPITS